MGDLLIILISICIDTVELFAAESVFLWTWIDGGHIIGPVSFTIQSYPGVWWHSSRSGVSIEVSKCFPQFLLRESSTRKHARLGGTPRTLTADDFCPTRYACTGMYCTEEVVCTDSCKVYATTYETVPQSLIRSSLWL